MADTFPAPATPGVYLFRGREGEVLYVGKSTNLKRRVLDHLHVRVEKDAYLVESYARVEFVPTHSEREALLLEANLIREHRPRYNVLLKDDRSYPYIQVTTGEAFPRISLVRRPRRSRKATLFGPYTSAREARSLVWVLEDAFHTRRCVRLPKRECIYYHMGLCPAPCTGKISPEAYGEQVRRAILVLQGRKGEVMRQLEEDMRRSAGRQEFERAILLRDAMAAVGNFKERQRVSSPGKENMDILALSFPRETATGTATVALLRVRDGQVVGAEPHALTLPVEDTPGDGEILSNYILQDYSRRSSLGSVLYVPPLGEQDRQDLKEATDLLLAERGVETWIAERGRPKALLELAHKAAETYPHVRGDGPLHGGAAAALQRLLSLRAPPDHIEGIDISILQGVEAVGSLVVFRGGRPAKDEYRRFRIREVEGMNDFAMVHEVVLRRFRRLQAEAKELPDLLLIDGGAGQVSSAYGALSELHLEEDVPLIGLAKKEEEIYRPGASVPLRPERNSPAMLLLRHVRDESHRFAVTYHRKRRQMALREELQ